ncbi:hypothetical protein Plhal304r1_c017g0061681 [Plasmopara halstedii]
MHHRSAHHYFRIFLTMIVPTVSTLLLLKVSMCSASNSSTSDPVVIVRHLNHLLPSANNNLTSGEEVLKSYNESVQDNTDIDETEKESRAFSFLKAKSTSPLQNNLLPGESSSISTKKYLVEIINKAMSLYQRDDVQNQKLYGHLLSLLQVNDLELQFFARVNIAFLLTKKASSEIFQDQLLQSQTRLSTVFDILMSHTKDESLESFFHHGLQDPLLNYFHKYWHLTREDNDQIEVSNEVYHFLTADRKDGNLLTWLGTSQIIDVNNKVGDLIKCLVTRRMTVELAFRLQTMQNGNLMAFFDVISALHWLPHQDLWLEFAAFTRFGFIEHETKSSAFVMPQVYKFLKDRQGILKDDQEKIFTEMAEKKSEIPALETNLRKKFDWALFDADQVRLFKAILQSNDQVELVKKALTKSNQVELFKAALSDEKSVKMFEAVLQDKKAMQLLIEVVGDSQHLDVLEKALSKAGSKEVLDAALFNAQVRDMLDEVVKIDQNLWLLKEIVKDHRHVELLTAALKKQEQLILVEDMLSSTELDSMNMFKALLAHKKKVDLLKEAVRDDTRLELFRLLLEGDQVISQFKTALGNEDFAEVIHTILNDVNQVFFLRVAIKDDDRVNSFQAALHDRTQIENFEAVLSKKKLKNVFRAMLKNEEQLAWLQLAVENDFQFKSDLIKRDQRMLATEMLEYLKTVHD